MHGQADLFLGFDEKAAPIRQPATTKIQMRPQGQERAFRLNPSDFEMAAQALEASGHFRVLRRLQPRPIMSRAAVLGEKVAVIVDTETTGLATPAMRSSRSAW